MVKASCQVPQFPFPSLGCSWTPAPQRCPIVGQPWPQSCSYFVLSPGMFKQDFSRQTGAPSFACESWAVQGGGAGSSALVGSFPQLPQPEGPHLQLLKQLVVSGRQAGLWVWHFVFPSLCSQCCSSNKDSVVLVSGCMGRCDFCTGIPEGGYIQLISIPDGARSAQLRTALLISPVTSKVRLSSYFSFFAPLLKGTCICT